VLSHEDTLLIVIL